MVRKGRPASAMEGRVFGRLTVARRLTGAAPRPRFLCICECGQEKIAPGGDLRKGSVQSCGCMKLGAPRKAHFHAVVTRLFRQYQRGAERRGLDFDLSREQFTTFLTMPCEYCGTGPRNKGTCRSTGELFFYSGVDRVRSFEGYTRENTVPCCAMCNFAKRHWPVDQFLAWAARIHSHQDHRRSLAKE